MAMRFFSYSAFNSHCPSSRNISDENMAIIADAGGLVGMGFWAAKTCGEGTDAIVGAIRRSIDQLSLEHIALSSDWDGSMIAPISAARPCG